MSDPRLHSEHERRKARVVALVAELYDLLHEPANEAPAPAPSTRLLSERDMADELGVSTGHLGRMRRAGTVPHIAVGEAIRYDPAAVRAALAAAPPEPVQPRAPIPGVRLVGGRR